MRVVLLFFFLVASTWADGLVSLLKADSSVCTTFINKKLQNGSSFEENERRVLIKRAVKSLNADLIHFVVENVYQNPSIAAPEELQAYSQINIKHLRQDPII